MANDLIILNFLKEKGYACKTDLIPLLKDLYPKAVNGSVEELKEIAPTINNLIETLQADELLKTTPSNFGMIGWSKASVYLYLDDVSLLASITKKGIQYIQSFNPVSSQTIHVSGNGNNVNQSSFDNSRDITLNQKIEASNQPIESGISMWIKLWIVVKKWWWFVIIPLGVIVIGLIIEHKWFKFE